MIFDITLNGVKVQKDIPARWEDVKFKDFIQIQDNKELTALSVFTGIEPETLKLAHISNLNGLIKALGFLKSDVPMFGYPKKILNYELRQDLEFISFGQYSDIKDELDKGKQGIDLIKQFPLLCAIYITNPYDFKEAELRADEFNNAPVTEVLAVGNFLLMKLLVLRAATDQTSRKHLTPLKRLKLVLRGWRSRLVFRVRFFILKKKLNIQ